MNPENPFVDNADLIQVLEEAPPTGEVPLPPHLLFHLERTRRDALAGRNASNPPERPIPAGGTRILLPANPTPLPRRRPLSQVLQWAAAVAILGAAAAFFLNRPDRTPGGGSTIAIATADITLTAPGPLAGTTQPGIAWQSRDQPGQTYDVWILPAEGDYLKAPALFKAEAVTSPVRFAALKPGKGQTETTLKSGEDYRVLVCLAGVGRMAGVPVPFKVSASAP